MVEDVSGPGYYFSLTTWSCLFIGIYTEQKKKRNNYISLNFELTLIQSEIIAFSTSALDIRLPNARNRFSF